MTYNRIPLDKEEEEPFYYVAHDAHVHSEDGAFPILVNPDKMYAIGNYYQDRKTAENNARAQILFQQLRQFAALNDELVFPKTTNECYCIEKLPDGNIIAALSYFPTFGALMFKSYEGASAAIAAFRKELEWYFNNYEAIES